MEMIPKRYETVADIPADEFLPLQKNTEEEREQITAPSLNFIQDSWRRLKKNKAAVISMFLLLVIILISVITIFVSPHDPTAQNVAYINLPPRIPGINIDGLNGKAMVGGELVDKYAQANVPSNVNFFLGTDGLGRDMLTRIVNGGRITMTVGAISVVIAAFIGIILGGLAGYFGGTTDLIIMRIAEIIGGLPFIPFAMILSAVIGSRLDPTQRMYLIMVVLGVLSWTGICRQIGRAHV